MVQPTDLIVIIAAIGAILYALMKYRDKKRADPATVFDLTYAIAAVVAIEGAAMVVSKLGLQLDTMGVIEALFMGFTFNAGLSSVNSKIPIELPVGGNSTALAALQKKVAEQDETIKKLQAK